MTAEGPQARQPAESAQQVAGERSGQPKRAWTRRAVWEHLGAPTDQEGSVNDPRIREEHGVRWNEKWIYRAEHGQDVVRLVLWNRYDLAGVFRAAPDGSLEAEPLETA